MKSACWSIVFLLMSSVSVASTELTPSMVRTCQDLLTNAEDLPRLEFWLQRFLSSGTQHERVYFFAPDQGVDLGLSAPEGTVYPGGYFEGENVHWGFVQPGSTFSYFGLQIAVSLQRNALSHRVRRVLNKIQARYGHSVPQYRVFQVQPQTVAEFLAALRNLETWPREIRHIELGIEHHTNPFFEAPIPLHNTDPGVPMLDFVKDSTPQPNARPSGQNPFFLPPGF